MGCQERDYRDELRVVQRLNNSVFTQLTDTIRTTLLGSTLNSFHFGIDLCSIPEMAEALRDTGFVERYFTERERSYCGRFAERYATNFAIKEAVVKVMRHLPGWLTEIEVQHEPCGAPFVNLSGKAQMMRQELGIEHLVVSATSEGNFALAACIGFGRKKAKIHLTHLQ